jgi:uncharacterized protein (TIGR00730 family)
MQSVAVFCGSSFGSDPRYREIAFEFGALLARRRLALVYGGARVGLMGALAAGTLGQGGRVIGVIPEALKAAEIAHEKVSELIVVRSMHERKAKISELADAFVVLRGGAGTMDEFSKSGLGVSSEFTPSRSPS